jgi:hypothetical protein
LGDARRLIRLHALTGARRVLNLAFREAEGRVRAGRSRELHRPSSLHHDANPLA